MKTSKWSRKIGSGVLLLTVILGTNACGKKTEQQETGPVQISTDSQPVTETVAAKKDDLPETLDFGNAEVTIHSRGDDSAMREIYAEAETADLVNDAVYRRNRMVEERLGVQLHVFQANGWERYDQSMTQLSGAIQAGDSAFDIVAGWSARIPSMSLTGCFLNLKEVPYLDLSHDYWNQSAVNGLAVNDKLYFASGDIALTMWSSAYATFFNKKLAEQYDVENLYQAVLDGTWTFDKLYGYSKEVYRDINGDGKADEEDLYGAVFKYGTNETVSFMYAADIDMLKQDSDGYYLLNTDNRRLLELAEKTYRMYFENSGAFSFKVGDSKYGAGYEQTSKMFIDDRALFMVEYLDVIRDYGLNDMETAFGILPLPKLDENQSDYGTYIQNAVSIWCVPISCKDAAMSGAVMEALASESFDTVINTYWETVLKIKYSRDDESAKMLDIIRDSASFSFQMIYNESIGAPMNFLCTLVGTKNPNAASVYEKNAGKYEKALEKVMNAFQKIDG